MNYDTLSELMAEMSPQYDLRIQVNAFMKANPDDWLCPLMAATATPTSRKKWKVIEAFILGITLEQWARPRLAAVLARLLTHWRSYRALPKKHIKELKANAPTLVRFCRLNRWNPRPAEWRTLLSATHFVDLDEVLLGRGMDKSDLLLFRNATHLRNLKSLYIDCGLTSSQARRLFPKPHLRPLQTLRISGQPIGDEGATALSMAIGSGPPNKRMNQLQTLNLSGCGIGSTGAAALLGLMSFKTLISLDLSNNPTIGDHACAKLVESGQFYKSLCTLELSHTGLGDAGAQALASANLPRLSALGLSGNDIGDDGAVALAGASWFSGLHRLSLGRNRIGARGRAALEAALPAGATLMLEDNAPQEPISTDDALQALQAGVGALLLSGQLSSSSDAPFTVVHHPGPVEDLCSESFYDVFQLDPSDNNHVISRALALTTFWNGITSWHESQGQGAAEARAVGAVFKRLRQPMAVVQGRDSLHNDPNHPVYLLGRTADNQLVGLRSVVCWA